ncbi:hypothetical protein AMAG_11860 [Allomyces macrogynus ATCC 38327]|uniref:Uncharacterized protein n=1 Tax=Allomyces macrogynus (strain ATCC 38327) TaxID=578462 RepID=A0A0L0SYH0_ALLM3|nr:hypothetical protein AMAG_11860 [Allomyces macrogynus ATCC 38327]|eukprot:KNE67394.1 hypothetical protein AMAG_11860 [Allomyces macrogynus ATCC 38327]
MAEHAALVRRFGQLEPHPSRPKVLTFFPLMDEEQRVNMVETVLVSLFEYMIDICAKNPCSVLDYAAQHCHKPVYLTTSLMAYIGFLHQLTCKCLLDLRWAGPAGDLRNFTYERPVSVPFHPYHGFLEKAFMLKDLGLRVVRDDEFDVVPQSSENVEVAHDD